MSRKEDAVRGRGRLLATTLALAAAAALLLPPAGVAQFGKNKIQYRQFDWKIYHSPHFDVYYYEEEADLLQKVVSFAESAYDSLSQEFDYQIKQTTPLIFYETHSAFEQNNIILNFIPEGIGAFASPVRNRMVLPVDLPDPQLMELILHELTHIFQYNILCGGKTGRCAASAPPTWFMEGMASYMAKDESARDRMYLRDAVVNDRIPAVTSSQVSGFFAYRFGHAVFDFIEEKYGKEAFRDFMIEMRNTIGARVGRAVERTFRMDPEDFDGEFRRWLRRRYLPELIETGEPGDFGRPFRTDRSGSAELSPAASPSGDLIAAFSTTKGDLDVVLFDARERELLRNLTKGWSADYQYFVVQDLAVARRGGLDLVFSPDGNSLAFFARQDRGRKLVLIDVLKGKISRDIEMDVEQQVGLTWSPDGSTIAFGGHRDGRFDIFEIELASGEVRNLTSDGVYDHSPAYSPDGRSVVFSSVVGGYAKLFRVDRDKPAERFQLTRGESNETDAIYSADGSRIYFTSDRSGADNIYGLDLESGQLTQHTNSVTGCSQPAVLARPDGSEELVFTAFWKGRFDLYRLDIKDPITEPIVIADAAEPEVKAVRADELPRFEPSIEVAIDEGSKDEYGGFKLFIEDAGGTVGVSDDQTFIAQAYLSFTDYLGDKRVLAAFQSIESFQNFNVIYTDLSRRWRWQVHVFDDRDFFIGRDAFGRVRRGTSALSQTGVIGSIIYPINTNHRVEFGLGYQFREIDFQSFVAVPYADFTLAQLLDIFPELESFIPPEPLSEEEILALFRPLFPGGQVPVPVIQPRSDDYPLVQAALVGDGAVFAPWGGVSGRRWRLSADWAPDTEDSGTLTSTLAVDFRQYLTLTRRSNVAFRFVGLVREGNFATPFYFGGLDTLRGFEFRSIVGDRGFFANLELRFPLIDLLATPILTFQGVRALFFLDVGGAWFDEFQDFDFWDSENDRLGDAVSSYGFGLTARIFGLDWNFDYAKRWDFDQTIDDGFRSSFWIGRRF
jgi:Tol biopolymer transport system component